MSGANGQMCVWPLSSRLTRATLTVDRDSRRDLRRALEAAAAVTVARCLLAAPGAIEWDTVSFGWLQSYFGSERKAKKTLTGD